VELRTRKEDIKKYAYLHLVAEIGQILAFKPGPPHPGSFTTMRGLRAARHTQPNSLCEMHLPIRKAAASFRAQFLLPNHTRHEHASRGLFVADIGRKNAAENTYKGLVFISFLSPLSRW
jgi:hypothetical protein